ncbi:MAG: hypothetical protein AAF620_19540 [Bacteroidota bacterium]
MEEQEYQKVWKPIQDTIFNQGKNLPDLIYRPEFNLMALRGGCLFAKEDFEKLQKAMQEAGDDYFVIIQHSQEFTENEPMFRMKFPVNTTWDELTSGNYISAILLEMSYNEYYVFGEHGNWGKYSANDYEQPLDIIGFKPEYEPVFKKNFEQPPEEWEELKEWLPPQYKEIIK